MIAIDIETVVEKEWGELTESQIKFWEKRTQRDDTNYYATGDTYDYYQDQAAMHPCFGRVICISYYKKPNLGTYIDGDEHRLLTNFKKEIENESKLLGHNIKNFDIPFLCARFLKHGIELPPCLQLSGKKPWEVPHVDTMELMKFGSYGGNFMFSLANACELVGIESPKDGVDGSMVGGLWAEREYGVIKEYCEGDVRQTVKLYKHLITLKA